MLPPGKVTIANLNHDYKDASDALMAGDGQAICKAIWMPNLTDRTVSCGKDLLELVTTPNPPNDHEYPYDGPNAKLHGSDMESLSRLLQDRVSESPPFVETWQLTFLKRENGSVTWHLKNPTGALL